MAAGIAIRRLAPLLADKREEPPVVAVAEDGSAVVPLLGGHRGANRLARRIARTLGVQGRRDDGKRCPVRRGAGRSASGLDARQSRRWRNRSWRP